MDRTEPTTRAVIYTRVSTDEQARDGLGLSIQLKRCRAYAEAQGWSVVETFTDAGVSGGNIPPRRLGQSAMDMAAA